MSECIVIFTKELLTCWYLLLLTGIPLCDVAVCVSTYRAGHIQSQNIWAYTIYHQVLRAVTELTPKQSIHPKQIHNNKSEQSPKDAETASWFAWK